MLLMEGSLHRGFEVASEGIKPVWKPPGRKPHLPQHYTVNLGRVYYHWHQLDMERKYIP